MSELTYKTFFCVVKHILLLRLKTLARRRVTKKNYDFGKIYAVCYSMGKKIRSQPFTNIPIRSQSVCMKFFSR